MKAEIEQKIFELDRKLQNIKMQYQLQIDELTSGIEKEKCMLSMALNSPVEFSSTDEIVVPERTWINPESIVVEPTKESTLISEPQTTGDIN